MEVICICVAGILAIIVIGFVIVHSVKHFFETFVIGKPPGGQ